MKRDRDAAVGIVVGFALGTLVALSLLWEVFTS